MYKKLGLSLALVLMSGNAWAEDYVPCAGNPKNCWQCGDMCEAKLDENGTLTVSGQGKMWGYDTTTRFETPWYEDKLKIKKIVVEDGIENIGKFSFFDCNDVKTVNLSQSVKKVDYYAFDQANKVQYISMYDTTVWTTQDDFGTNENKVIDLHCYGDLKTCQSNFLGKMDSKFKAKPRFILRGKKIYTVEEAMEVTKDGDKFHVMLTYK